MYAESRQGKRITVFVNGDPFSKGKVVTVNNHDTPSLERLCSFLNLRVQNPLGGCYRRLYTPNGTEIRELDQIEGGCQYVVARDRYKSLKDFSYKDIPDRTRHVKSNKKFSKAEPIHPVTHAWDEKLRKEPGRSQDLNRHNIGLRLRVHKNGENTEAYHPVTILPRDKDNFSRIAEEISTAMGLPPIKQIYKIINLGGVRENFIPVTEAKELEQQEHLLVIPRTGFGKELNVKVYPFDGMNPFYVLTSPRIGPYWNYPSFQSDKPQTRHNFSLNRHKVVPSIGSSKQSDAMSPFSNPPGSQGERKGNKPKRGRGRREVDYDKDEGGVYRAKNQNNAKGAHQEEIHSKEKTTPIPPGTELNKRPSKETKQNADGASQTKNKTEVKKGGKNGKDMNKLSVLPPIVDEGKKNGGANKVKKDEMKDIKEGVVKETVDKFEGNTGEGLGLDDPFSAEKESTPNDLKTDDIIEMTEREITPVDLKSSNVEVTKPPLSTTPPQGKLSKGPGKVQERVDEDAAAAKIQAGARAYKARKEYKEKKEAQRRDMNNESDRLDDEARRREEEALRNEEEERRQENAHWQAEQDRQREEEEARWQAEQEREREMNAQKKKMDEDQAATRIQASFKGHKARKEYQAKKQTQVRVDDNKQSKSEKEIEAATKIQSGFRGYKVRKEYNSRKKQIKETDINDNEKKDIDDDNVGKKTMNEDDAAVAIQAGFKGYKTRKEFAQKKAQAKAENEESRVENKMDIDKKQHEAATQIQANFRGFRARKQYTEKKKNAKVEAESATRIQASFRGFRARKELSEKKKEPQLPDQAPSPKGDDEEAKNRAATKIQSGFRGYKARKDYKAKVIDEHIVETDVAQLPDSAVSVQKGQFIQGIKGDAASEIQSAFWVYRAKKTLEKGGDVYGKEDIRVSNEADEKIIAAYKGFRTRKIEKEIFEKKTSAAHKIQSSYKGYKVRKTKFYPVRAVNLLHSAVRGYITRKLNNVRVAANVRVTSVVNGGHYASIIQALCKGFLTRHTVRTMRERSKAKPNSAKSLQGPTEFTESQESDNEISYWKDTHIKMYSDKTLRKAAAKIQAIIYAYKTRKLFSDQKKSRYGMVKPAETEKLLSKGNAIPKIQSCFKGYLERAGVKNARVEKEMRESAKKEDMNESDKGIQENTKLEHEPRLSQERELRPHPPSSPHPVSARSSRLSGRKRPRSGRPSSGRPTSRQARSSSQLGSNAAQRGSSGKVKGESSDFGDDTNNETEKEKIDAEFPKLLKEESLRSSTRLSGTAGSIISETVLNLSDIDKEQGRGSAKSFSTWKSSEKVRSSRGEVEREGESLREVEDDAGELSSIEKNVNAVGQLQAAFRAYKMRREISELMSGGGELMDITKIDRAVSALRKDFRLRSAKVRRLGSYQFGNEKPISYSKNWWENVDDDADDTVIVQDKEDLHGHETKMDISRNNLGGGNDGLTETDSSKGAKGLYENDLEFERLESISKIKAAVKGYKVRRGIKESGMNEQDAKKKIEAAYRGYRTRLTESRINSRESDRKRSGSRTSCIKSAGSRASGGSVRTIFHVKMHSDVINERCTRLQAAFAAYQTRKVFMSLSKLVEQNGKSNYDTSGHKLERMGSLSETDDFKLRHKSIAKIQAAYESHRIAHEAKRGSTLYSKGVTSPRNMNRYMVLPPINQSVQHMQDHSCRPKSGILRNHMTITHVSEGKAKTQPDLFRHYGHTSDNNSLNKIEIFIKKKTAATTIQSHATAYLIRTKMKTKKAKLKPGRKTPGSIGRKTPVPLNSTSSKVTRECQELKDIPNRTKEDMTMTEMVRVRTASIKLEAERRKVIAEKIRLKQQAEAKEAGKTKSVYTSKVKVDRSDSPIGLPSIPSSRLLTDRSWQANDLKAREDHAAVKIQKVYRGHRTRQDLVEKSESKKQLNNEYEDWKIKRKNAAVAIQSTWRGYSVRKAKSDDESGNEIKDERIKDDFSHLEDEGLLVINIGRSKSEIERANRKYDNASMIQMIFRACKVRRKFAIKAAKQRHLKNKAASKIQALYKGFVTRYELRESVSATRIQSVVKAFLARDNMEERKRVIEEEQQKAASLIQAVYMSFRKRRENEAMKKERRFKKAAEDIQTVGKAFMLRWEHSRKREKRQMIAASKIQAAFTGHREREKTNAWREAGIVIMAGFRSFKARQVVQALKDKLKRERHAATRLQAAYNAYTVRKSNQLYKEKMARQKQAATRIQCSLRGRKARRDYKIQKQLMKEKRESAALKIQSVYRGHKGREIARKERQVREMHSISEDMINLILNRTFDYYRRRTDSSERIQATVKGYQTRNQMTCKLSDEAKQRMADASVIQAAYRATTDRKETDKAKQAKQKFDNISMIQTAFRAKIDRKQTSKARQRRADASVIQAAYRVAKERKRTDKVELRNMVATLIQAVFRAKHIRKKQDNKILLELMNESATKIQCLYRGYRCRTEIEKEREMIANLEPPPSALISARTRSGKLLSISMDEVLMKNSRAIILFHRKATELQAAFRAYGTRTEMKDRLFRKTTVAKKTPRRVLSITKKLTKEEKAAILIQKTFRGYWNRMVYKNAISQRRKLRDHAATNLQVAVKGYRARVEESGKIMRLKKEGMSEVWRQKQEAANIISFAFRSHQHRKEKKALRVEM